ncbi:MAG: hypothetical protein ACPHFR_08490, partial [Cycloclasticus sp.]
MRTPLLAAGLALAFLYSHPILADSDLSSLKQQLNQIKQHYEQRIQALENRLEAAEKNATHANSKVKQIEETVIKSSTSKPAFKNQNSFNPAISLILDGRYASFSNKPEEYELPGFALGGESGLGEEGFSLGHTELVASANIDDKFYGQATLALHDHEGSTEVELEEAFIQTIGLGNGVTVKGGRF